MIAEEITIQYYRTENGNMPFAEWLRSLDSRNAARIRARLGRVRLGNLSDTKSLKRGLYELRVTIGPGYRIYFAKEGNAVIILLSGGGKSSQTGDISTAREYFKDYLERKNA